MSYQATVIPVMIASPSDVMDCRDAARDATHDWNYMHSHSEHVVLMPMAWETQSSPELGQRARELSSKRLPIDCDLFVAMFWTRLGTRTGESLGGMVEEIQRHVRFGKPAMIYFSTAPVAPETINRDQYRKLRDFKEWCRAKGLVEEFENLEAFRRTFTRRLPILLKEYGYLGKVVSAGAAKDIDPFAKVGAARARTVKEPVKKPVKRVESIEELSKEAKTLLVEAAESKDGVIISTKTPNSRLIESNGRTFGVRSSRGSMVLWELAIESLVHHGLIKPSGKDGDVFKVTAKGYQCAEQFKALV